MVNNELFPYKIDILDQKEGIEYVACRNAALVHINSLDKHIGSSMKYPAKLNGFITIICTRGEVTLSAHMIDYTIKQNDVFIAPTSVVEFKWCKDCEIYIAAFNSDFAASMNIDLQVIMPIISSLHSQCLIHTINNPVLIQALHHSFNSIHNEFLKPIPNSSASKFREMSIRHMYASMIYRLCEFITQCNNDIKTIITQKDRSSDYFKQLIHLLHEHYKAERSVEFYASKMGLTPKHLSRVVRTYSGKSVHQWIDEFVVLEIKNLLKFSDMSIQQISYELNFPNPSFMGQYFKRITGKTPGEYRKEI
jgi:AraC-like DNA-binding protein